MKQFFVEMNDKFADLVDNYFQKVVDFLSKGYYVVYAAIALLALILIIAGLFTCLKRAPKFFFIVVLLLGLVVLLWYFFVHK